jgi:Fe-Mn family superoxide dismutase
MSDHGDRNDASLVPAGRRELASVSAANPLVARGVADLRGLEGRKPFTLPPLPYPPDALEGAIDKMTMEIHHGRHHKAYVDKLNKALEGQGSLQNLPVEQLLRKINEVPRNIRQAVINNGGGHANHSMFWLIMGPKAGGKPRGLLADALNSAFGDFATFQAKFKEAALGRFGSGWAWLVRADGKLQLWTTTYEDGLPHEWWTPS